MTQFRKHLPTILLVLLAVFTTAFAFMNFSNPVRVWPLMSTHPLTIVIAVAFGMGAGAGALVTHILRQKRTPIPVVVPTETVHR